MDQAAWLLISVAYLLAHLGAYVLVLRRLRSFGRELTIFVYHLASFCLVGCASVLAAIAARLASPVLELAVIAVAGHALYSLSFLELWSLAQGGYSLSVLRHVEGATRRGLPVDLGALEAIGASKKDDRVRGLLRLRLACQTGECLELTRFGWIVGAALGAVAWAANLRRLG